jgi:hypothetical protein
VLGRAVAQIPAGHRRQTHGARVAPPTAGGWSREAPSHSSARHARLLPARVWSVLSQPPASKVASVDLGEVVVLEVDATLVTSHSEKEQAAEQKRLVPQRIDAGDRLTTRGEHRGDIHPHPTPIMDRRRGR